MNIHLDYQEFQNSQYTQDILGTAQFGSTMYGTNNIDSDIDMVVIMKNIRRMPIVSHHQIQLKRSDDGIHKEDIVVTTLDQFIYNLLNGDSTVNYEIIMQNCLNGSNLEFMHNFKKMFSNYNIISSYYGMAKRDIKSYRKTDSIIAKRKKLGHIVRGILTANFIMNNYDTIDSKTTLENVFSMSLQITQFINDQTDALVLDSILEKYEQTMITGKSILNTKLENQEIHKVYIIDEYKKFLDEYDVVNRFDYISLDGKNMITDTLIEYVSKDVIY